MKPPGYYRMHCNLKRGEPTLSKELCYSLLNHIGGKEKGMGGMASIRMLKLSIRL